MPENISIKDTGVLFGYGLFETIRVYDNVPFLLGNHLKRLTDSLRDLFFPSQHIPRKDAMAEIIKDYIMQNHIAAGGVRFSVTFGNSQEEIPPSIFIMKRGIPYSFEDYQRGVAAVISSFKKNEHSPLVRHKTFNYLENLISLRVCADNQAKECIFLNNFGAVSECSKSNIFFSKNGLALTPSIDCGLLPGVTRKHTILLLRRNGIKVIEGVFRLEDLLKSDECFITNSLIGIMPVVKIDGRIIGCGEPGKLTRLAMSLYDASIKKHVHSYGNSTKPKRVK
ncbi:aminotransferase class IV family protein [Candidatus Roizmanbacteria bacterium]|nr:aminotransferase class IV family protein [Candidatus Roizmanbacteria bacterium]